MQFENLYTLMKYARNYGHQQIKEAGVSDTEHLICTFLFGHPNSSQDDVSEALQIDKTTIAKALTNLEKKDYIQRTQNPKNRRKNIINITPLGKETIRDVINVYDSWLSKISDALSPEEWEQFKSYCQRLHNFAKSLYKEDQE